MKSRSLFSKLFPTYFLISLAGLVILLLITRLAFQNFYFKETTANLVQKAKILEKEIKILLKTTQGDELEHRIQYISEISENRLTLILPDGKVLADSAHGPHHMENHGTRPEIAEAIKGHVGKSLRFSDTLGEEQMYVALPIYEDNKLIAIFRNSVSVEKLQTSLLNFTHNVILWSMILLLVLTYFIFIQAKKISLPLESMKAQIESFAANNFQDRIEMVENTTEEISSLFLAVKAMSEKLQAQFLKINKQKNEQLAVFASMLEGVVTIYPDLNIYHINKAALELFHYEKTGPIKGTPLYDVVKSRRIIELARTVLEKRVRVDKEVEYESGLILNIHGTIVESEESGMLGAVLVFNDVTKVRELENHRKDFVANVSHELKTPLTAIQGYVETLMEEEISDKSVLDKFLKVISRHSSRLKSIIEDLLSLSAIEKDSSVGDLKLKEHNIRAILEDVVFLSIDRAQQKGMKIDFDSPDIKININGALIEQAILNLLDNAIKYGPANSTIDVRAARVGDKLQITIRDRGKGIPKEHHERLFERFYSVDKARSRELGGSGLGLSIVKHIALFHQGNVYLDSSVTDGAAFVFEIPLGLKEES